MQGEVVQLPVVQAGLDGAAGLQDVAAAHCGAEPGPGPGLRLYLESGGDSQLIIINLFS